MECRRMCTFSVPALFLPSWEDPVIWTIGYRLFFRACVRHPREGCPYRVSLASLKESESVEGGSILHHHWQIAVPRPLGIGVGPRPTCPFWSAYSSSVEFFFVSEIEGRQSRDFGLRATSHGQSIVFGAALDLPMSRCQCRITDSQLPKLVGGASCSRRIPLSISMCCMNRAI